MMSNMSAPNVTFRELLIFDVLAHDERVCYKVDLLNETIITSGVNKGESDLQASTVSSPVGMLQGVLLIDLADPEEKNSLWAQANAGKLAKRMEIYALWMNGKLATAQG